MSMSDSVHFYTENLIFSYAVLWLAYLLSGMNPAMSGVGTYKFFSSAVRFFPWNCKADLPVEDKFQPVEPPGKHENKAETYFIMKLNDGGSFIAVINNLRIEKEIPYWSSVNYLWRLDRFLLPA